MDHFLEKTIVSYFDYGAPLQLQNDTTSFGFNEQNIFIFTSSKLSTDFVISFHNPTSLLLPIRTCRFQDNNHETQR